MAALLFAMLAIGFGLGAMPAAGHGDEDQATALGDPAAHADADIVQSTGDLVLPDATSDVTSPLAAGRAMLRSLGGPLTLDLDEPNPHDAGLWMAPFDTNDTLDGTTGREKAPPVECYIDIEGQMIPHPVLPGVCLSGPAGIVPVFTALLPSGKLLAWDYEQRDGIPGDHEDTRVLLYDPATNTSVRKDVTQAIAGPDSGVNLFCAGYTQLPNGNLLVVGGNLNDNADPIASTFVFDWQAESWTRGPDMARKRWYPSVATMANGEALIVGGDPKDTPQENHGETADGFPEVWQLDGSLRQLTDLTAQTDNFGQVTNYDKFPTTRLYPFLAPSIDGRVLYAGFEREYLRLVDPRGAGSQTRFGPRETQLRQYGSFAQYKPDQVMVNGGGPYDATSRSATATGVKISMLRDSGGEFSNPAPGLPAASSIADMNHPRRMHYLTILPDGNVLATGGKGKVDIEACQALPTQDLVDECLYKKDLVDLSNPVKQAELWNPQTGAWTELASAAKIRQYHSFATLMPSGEVLTGGGGDCGACAYRQYDEPNFEVFKPPYLFAADGHELTDSERPRITGGPALAADIRYDATFEIDSPDAADVERINLVKLGAATHSVDQGQRLVELTDFSAAGGELTVRAPANGFEAPPGYYMLFLLDGDGVPSKARIIRFGGHDSSAGETRPLLAKDAVNGSDAGQVFGSGSYSAERGHLAQVGNNAISRLNVADGYEVRACAGTKLAGACELFAAGTHDDLSAPLNNKISSLQVCDAGECPADDVPPNTTISSAPSASTADTSATIVFSSDDESATFECSLDGGAASACTSPRQLTGLAIGEHTFTVTAIDAAANPDPSPASVTWDVLDATDPTVAITVPDPIANSTASQNVTFSVSDDVGITSVECKLDGATYAPCASPFATGTLSAGTHIVYVRATDTSSNVTTQTAQIVVDLTPPVVVASSPVEFTSSGASQNITFAALDEVGVATVECQLDDGAFGACISPAGTGPLAEGVHTFTVRATDTAGNVGTDHATVTVDQTPPVINIAPPVSPTANTAGQYINFTVGDNFALDTVECKLDAQAYTACGSPRFTGTLTPATHTAYVRATDRAGNVAVATATIDVDTVPPLVVITGPANNQIVSTPTVTLFYSVADSGGSTPPCDKPNGAVIGLTEGVNTITVSCMDLAGNIGSASVVIGYQPGAAPPPNPGPPSIKKLPKKMTFGPQLKVIPTCPAGCRIQIKILAKKRKFGSYTGSISVAESGKVFALKIAKQYRAPVRATLRQKVKVTLKVTLTDAAGRTASAQSRITKVR